MAEDVWLHLIGKAINFNYDRAFFCYSSLNCYIGMKTTYSNIYKYTLIYPYRGYMPSLSDTIL